MAAELNAPSAESGSAEKQHESAASESRFFNRQNDSRAALTQKLLQEAKQQLPELTALSQLPPYSRELLRMASRINHFVATPENAPEDIRLKDVKITTVVDPIRLDIARALNLSDGATAKLAAPGSEHSYYLTKEINLSAQHQDISEHGTKAYSATPECLTQSSNLQRVLIPASSAMLPYTSTITGLTYEQNIDYINKHEAWHCKVRTLEAGIESPAEKLSAAQRDEAFADAAAVGDMIYSGESTEIIDRVAAWRTANNKGTNMTHRTNPSLAALSEHINSMGLENFRTLSEQQRTDLYAKLSQSSRMDAEVNELYLQYKNAKPEEREALRQDEKDNPHMQKALALFDETQKKSIYYAVDRPSLTKEQDDALKAWNPLNELEDRAVKDHGKITPISLIKTYTTLQTEFQEQLKQQPNNLLLPEKASRLQQTFILQLSRLDYAAENKRYGIEINENMAKNKPISQTKPATPQI